MTRKPPAIVRRIIDASASIAADSPASIDYQHAVLCQVGMPRKATASDTFERTSGNASLQGIADALNARGIVTARGGRWHPATVRNIVNRGEQHQAA